MSASSYIDYTYRKRSSGHDGFRQSASTNNTFRNDPEFPVHLTMSGGRGGGNWRANKFGKRGGSSSRRGAKDDITERGRFDNGIWMCDCSPRLPAEHFQVKKESANKGRWFYTCQRGSTNRPKNQDHLHIPISNEQGCKFFLWDEDAKPREEAAVLMGARSEPRALLSQEEKRRQALEGERAQVQQPSNIGKRKRSFDDEGLRTPSSVRTVVHAATPPRSPTASFASAMSETMSLPPKRTLPWLSAGSLASSSGTTTSQIQSSTTVEQAGSASKAAIDDAETASEASSDGETFDWPLTGEDTSELQRVAEQVELNTPRKARKLDTYDTANHSLNRQANGLITPGTTPSKPTTIVSSEATTYSVTDTTPTPSRYRDALATPSSSHGTSTSLTPSFLALLRDHNITIPSPALSAMTSLLRRSEVQLAGAVKGRDVARQAVKAREETVARLTERVHGLEEEIAGLKALVSALGKPVRKT